MGTPSGRLKNKVCIITGSGQGIGKVAALKFASEGAIVYVAEANEKTGEETAREIRKKGGRGIFVRTDVSRLADVRRLARTVEKEQGRLHVIYNNASIYLPSADGKITEIAEKTWDRVLAVNLKSIYLLCRFGIPLMKEGGSIINTSSSAGTIGIPNCDAYTASKGATISLTRSLAVEYGPRGIRVNCIAPAGIRTPMMAQSNLTDSTFDEERFLALRSPSRRYGTPEEIASIAAFLASDESSYMNGAVVVADGGTTINGDLSRIPVGGEG